MATWKKLIEAEMKERGDIWTPFPDVVIPTYHEIDSPYLREKWFDESVLDRSFEPPLKTNWYDIEFDDGYGMREGIPFVLWTEKWVYFPVCYDGGEWVGSVPRDYISTRTETKEMGFIPQHFGSG